MTTNFPKVSVILPVYNEKPDFLTQSVFSILRQTWRDYELILLDDGSTSSKTLQVLTTLSKSDYRIRLHRNVSNQGLTKTLNIGLSLARGEIICRQDSDDWSEPERIEKQVYFLDQNPPIGMVGSNYVLHQENGNPLWITNLPCSHKDILAAFSTSNPFCHGAVCFRRYYANMIGGYRESFQCTQDYDFFWRLCECSGGVNLPQMLYHHRRTSQAVSTLRGRDQIRTTIATRILAQMRSDTGVENFELAMKQVEEALVGTIFDETSCVFRQADNLLLAGYYAGALRWYTKAVLKQPLKSRSYAKMIRWFLFVTVPFLRCWLFTRRLHVS